MFIEICCTFAAGEQIRWLHNGNRLDKQTKYVKIGDGELTIRVSEELVRKAVGGGNIFLDDIFVLSLSNFPPHRYEKVRDTWRARQADTNAWQVMTAVCFL